VEWTFTTRKAAENCLRRHLASSYPMSHEEIGRIFGISAARVQQIEKMALKKLAKIPEMRTFFEDLCSD
jgi:DNA-directed RNA polymerase sigma subunit (sigma70/sigma32)